MHGFGLLIASGLGSLGIALSTAILHRVFRDRRKRLSAVHHEEEAITLSKHGLDLPGPTTPLLKELRAENESDFSYDSTTCALRYGEDFYQMERANSSDYSMPKSPLSGASTESASLHPDVFSVGIDNEQIDDLGSEKFEDASLNGDVEELEEENMKSIRGVLNDDEILPEIVAKSCPTDTSQHVPLTAGTIDPEALVYQIPVVQPKTEIAEPHAAVSPRVLAAVSETTSNTISGDNAQRKSENPVGTQQMFTSTSHVVEAENQTETIALRETAPPVTKDLERLENYAPVATPATVPVVVKPRSTKSISSEIYAAPLCSSQIKDDPVSGFSVPVSAIIVQTDSAGHSSKEREVSMATPLTTSASAEVSEKVNPTSEKLIPALVPSNPVLEPAHMAQQLPPTAVLASGAGRAGMAEPVGATEPVGAAECAGIVKPAATSKPVAAAKPAGVADPASKEEKNALEEPTVVVERTAVVESTAVAGPNLVPLSVPKIDFTASLKQTGGALTDSGLVDGQVDTRVGPVAVAMKSELASMPVLTQGQTFLPKRELTVGDAMLREDKEKPSGERLSRKTREGLFGSRRSSRTERTATGEQDQTLIRRLSQRLTRMRPLRRSNTENK